MPVAGQLVSVIIIGAGENGYVRVKRGQTYLDLESPDPPPPTHVDRIQVFAIPAPGQDFDIGGSWARADALTFELYESGVGTPIHFAIPRPLPSCRETRKKALPKRRLLNGGGYTTTELASIRTATPPVSPVTLSVQKSS